MAIGSLIAGTVLDVFTGWMDRRGRIKEAEAQASIVNAGKVIDGSGWKEEYIVLIWSFPAIAAFVSGLQEYSIQGFENLAEAPEWYLTGWVGISLAIYGLKPATKKLIEWRKTTKAVEE
ncbi:MAG: hypothetical protein AAF542_00075 [Pseudomonadota bacterium]